jgi:hypothetical protein
MPWLKVLRESLYVPFQGLSFFVQQSSTSYTCKIMIMSSETFVIAFALLTVQVSGSDGDWLLFA